MKDLEDKSLIPPDITQRAADQITRFVKNILVGRMDEKCADKIVTMRTEARWMYGNHITLEEAKNPGLPIPADLSSEVYQLINLFPQVIRQRPSVRHMPVSFKRLKKKSEVIYDSIKRH
jgi:hypothetical protein